jgi:ribonuclease P protein component
MLSKKYRLPVQSVLKERGRLIRGRYLNIVIYNGARLYSRVGVVVPVAFSAKATERNEAKRAIYDAMDWQAVSKKPIDVVVRVTKSAHGIDSRAILDELRQLSA